MKEKSQSIPQPIAADFDSDLLLRELENFKIELTRPLTELRMKRWLGKAGENNPARNILMDPYMWGSIQWPKSFGRPLAFVMASAFDIEVIAYQLFDTSPDDPRSPYRIELPKRPPAKWDGPEDARHYRVSFLADIGGANAILIRVNFAPHERWVGRSRFSIDGYLAFAPPYFYYERGKTEDPPRVLKPLNIITQPF